MSANPGDQLGLLSRKLDALQTRVAPLAIAASQHLRKQLQLSQLAAARGGNPQMHPSAMMTEDERATLLEEMEVLQRLLHWSDGDARRERGEQHGTAAGRRAARASSTAGRTSARAPACPRLAARRTPAWCALTIGGLTLYTTPSTWPRSAAATAT